MDLQHTFESLKYQFNEAYYSSMRRDIDRYKAVPQKLMKDQTHDYAIIEYDGKNPVYSLWFASYMSENDFSVDRVEEIRLIGEPEDDSMVRLQSSFPKAKIVVINTFKSFDNEYADAIITYINELIDEGDEYAALEYLRKYKGNDDNVKKKLAELEEKFEVDDDDYDDDYYDDYDEGGGYEWTDEDAWDAMTDGQYGDYPGPGWDPERFGY